MIGIVVHHTCLEYHLYGSVIYMPLGYLLTGVFFLLSGYGLTYSLEKNKKIDFWRRLKKLLFPYVYCFVIYLLLLILFKDNFDCSFTELLFRFVLLSSPEGGRLWFFKVIVGVYIIFLTIFSLTEKKNIKIGAVLLLTMFYIFLCRNYRLDSAWSSSIICFPIGMLIYYNYELLNKTSKCRMLLIALFFMVVFSLLYYYVPQNGVLYTHHIFSCPFFAISIVILSSLISVHSKIVNYIGDNSLLFYFLEDPSIVLICTHVPQNHFVLNLTSLFSSYILAQPYTMAKKYFGKNGL